jgi:hypothetical protein
VEYEFTVVMDVSENHTARASKDRTSLLDGWSDRIGPQTGRMLRDWLNSGTEPVRAVAASMAPSPVMHADWPDDGVPDLDDLDVPSAESMPAGDLRDAINDAVPLRPQKPTVSMWLDQFATTLGRCASRYEVEAACLSDEVLKASRTLKGKARERLRELMDAALARGNAATGATCCGTDMHGIDIDDARP